MAAVLAVVLVVAAGGYVEQTNPAGISFSHPLGYDPHSASGAQDNNAATSTATVARRSLSETSSVNGTLGYAGSYPVIAQLHGTVTELPVPGQVIGHGQVLYQVDGAPVVLLYGLTPAYRSLAEGAYASDVTGADVAELNADLVALGYATHAEIPAGSDEFSWNTKQALAKLQAHLGYPTANQTGALTSGQAVFLPTAARIATVQATLGAPATGAVLTATSTTRQISVNLDASRQSQIKVGDSVTITLPDNRTTPGVVSSVGTVATAPSTDGSGGSSNPPTIPVQITPSDPIATGVLDQAPVQVAITTATVDNALVVPVNSLLALAGGGNAVEVVAADGTHHLVSVSLGIFDDAQGLVQVTGPGLTAGQHLVVPAS